MTTEADKTNTSVVATIVVVGTFAMIAISALVAAMVRADVAQLGAERPTDADLETVAQLDAQQIAKLNAAPSWSDRERRKVAIPIDSAMKLVLDEYRAKPEAASPPPPPGLVMNPGPAVAGTSASLPDSTGAASAAPASATAASPATGPAGASPQPASPTGAAAPKPSPALGDTQVAPAPAPGPRSAPSAPTPAPSQRPAPAPSSPPQPSPSAPPAQGSTPAAPAPSAPAGAPSQP